MNGVAGFAVVSTRARLATPTHRPMDSERRYSEDEVNAILDQATEAQTSRASSGSGSGSVGLTLRELREIGKEVGIAEADITRAANALDRPAPAATADRKFLGQTIGVGRTAELPRPLTDREWHHLVTDLRETFDAKGKLHEDGLSRSWTNSNLQVFVEPSGQGQRLRLRTVKGSARPYQSVGLGFMGASAALAIGSFLGVVGDPSDMLIFGIMGAAFFAISRLTVPSWARTRARQFEEIIDRALHLTEAPALGSGEE